MNHYEKYLRFKLSLVLGIVLADPENFDAVADIFKQDPCQPYYPAHLWQHLCSMLEVAPEQGIQLGFFELLHARIVNRLPKFWDLNSKAFALLLRCGRGSDASTASMASR